MKKFFAALGLSLLSLGAFSQKIGYVDTEYILNNVPEYKSKQTKTNGSKRNYRLDYACNQIKVNL